MARQKPPKQRNAQMTWAQAFRDVLIRFLSSQKYVPTLAFGLAMTIVLRAKPSDMVELAKALFTVAPSGERALSAGAVLLGIGGWGLAVILLVASIFVVRTIRSRDQQEIKRLSDERSALQERLLRQPLERSHLKDRMDQ